MYMNSGGSPVNVSGADPTIRRCTGLTCIVSRSRGYAAKTPPNTPAPVLMLSKSGMSDSHGIGDAGDDRYLWVMDRHEDVAEIIDLTSGTRVNTVNLFGQLSDNAAPDLVDPCAGWQPALRRAARSDAPERRSPQRDRQHAGPWHHPTDARGAGVASS